MKLALTRMIKKMAWLEILLQRLGNIQILRLFLRHSQADAFQNQKSVPNKQPASHL
jgi:hypothetical protein